MIPVSAALLGAVRGSHGVVSRARLVAPGQTGNDPTGTDLALIGGAVTLDGTADVRGTATLELAEPWPTGNGTNSLAPYGSEIGVSRGVVLGNGTVERIPLGIFRIVSVEQPEAPNGPLTVTCRDRWSLVEEASLLGPRQFNAGTTVSAIVASLVGELYPSLVVEYDDGTTTSAATLSRSAIVEERGTFLRDLARAYGKLVYFDYRGVLVFRDVPSTTAPVFDVDAGKTGVLVSAGRSLSRDGVYNAVVATGEGLDQLPPVVGYAFDLDPASVTFYNGPFGKVARAYSSPLIQTVPQATKAATKLLAKNIGLPQSVDFSMIPLPALEPFDAVRVTYSRTTLGNTITEVHVLDSLNIPLQPDTPMTATTRVSARIA